jgi:hypothetical protein
VKSEVQARCMVHMPEIDYMDPISSLIGRSLSTVAWAVFCNRSAGGKHNALQSLYVVISIQS